jgi:hypothetical protein
LKRAYIRGISLRCVKVSQFLWCANFAAIFVPGLEHLHVPSCKDPSTPLHIKESDALVMCRLNFLLLPFPFLRIRIEKWSAFRAFFAV